MTHFHAGHLPALTKNSKAVPHAYFYEMGRNYFTFGGRHDAFTTGFAVFMRYVCMDLLELHDIDKGTRHTIFAAIAKYEMGDLPFLRTFTNAGGLSEKQNRLKGASSSPPDRKLRSGRSTGQPKTSKPRQSPPRSRSPRPSAPAGSPAATTR